jgi:DNA-binding protein YbaB
MAGVGKLLRQSRKIERSIDAIQPDLDARETEVDASGGAARVAGGASEKFWAIALDFEFLKDDAKVFHGTLLAKVQDLGKYAKAMNDSKMQKTPSAFQRQGIT